MKNWGMPSRQMNADDQVPTGPSSLPSSPSGSNPYSRATSGRPLNPGMALGLGIGPNLNLGGQEETKPKPKKKWTPEEWEAAINAFYTRMNKGLDFSDPRTQSILNNARNTTLQSANDHGVYGGYSENAAEASYIKTAAGLQQHQDDMALQALGLGSGFSARMAEDQYQADLNQYMMDKESGGDLGSTIGGGLGALGGGILGIPGGPAGIIAGASAGWQVGSGIGGKIGGSVSGGNKPQWGF